MDDKLEGMAEALVILHLGIKLKEMEERTMQLSALASALIRRLTDGKNGPVLITREELGLLENSALRIEPQTSEDGHGVPDILLSVVSNAEAEAEIAKHAAKQDDTLRMQQAKHEAQAAINKAIFTSKTRH